MASTYEPIASTTLGSNTGTVEFASLPSTYTDLVIVGLLGTTSQTPAVRIRFNSDTSSNYSGTFLSGNGTAASSARSSSQTSGIALPWVVGLSASLENIIIIQVMSYASTSVYKTFLASSAVPSGAVERGVGLWRSTSAISNVKLALGSSFPSVDTLSGSTWSVYGIKAA